MSAVLAANGTKYFSVSLTTTAPTPNDNILIVAFVKRTTGLAVGSSENIVEAKAATEASALRVKGTTGPKFRAHGGWPNGSNTPTQATVYSENIWYSVAAYLSKSDGGSSTINSYWNGTKVSTSVADADTATESLTLLKIGQGESVNAYSRWPAMVAEVSTYTVAADADADTIVAAALTTKADAIGLPAGAALTNYWPLLNSVTASVGPDLTNNGSTTFDADHPSLSGAGGGGGDVFDCARGIARGIGRGVGMGIRRSIIEVRRPGLWLPPSLVGAR